MAKSTLLRPAKFKLDGGAMFGIIPKPLWSKLMPADDMNRIELSLSLWLIETQNRLILVDTGIGDYHPEKFKQQMSIQGPANPLESALTQVGKKLDDLSDIVLTHLHFDHVGGLGVLSPEKQIIPLCPKARVHLQQDHFHYAQKPTPRDQGSFQHTIFNPLLDYYREKKLLHFFNGSEGVILEDGPYQLKFILSHGHTPFMAHPFDDEFIYLADIIPTSNHLNPAWVMGYDMAPGISAVEKVKILKWVEEKKLKIIFEHDPKICASAIAMNDKGHYLLDHPLNVMTDNYQPLN